MDVVLLVGSAVRRFLHPSAIAVGEDIVTSMVRGSSIFAKAVSEGAVKLTVPTGVIIMAGIRSKVRVSSFSSFSIKYFALTLKVLSGVRLMLSCIAS